MEKIAEKSQFPRYEHLDSVRGIAAMLVAFYHSLRPFSEIPRDTGIIAVLNGHTAVLFFFILSGFVLSGSLNSRGEMNLKSLLGYWVRRFFSLISTGCIRNSFFGFYGDFLHHFTRLVPCRPLGGQNDGTIQKPFWIARVS
jgi:uncharacterized membrane protein